MDTYPTGVESLTLEVEGVKNPLEILSYNSTWIVNSIPTCEVSVAVGFKAGSDTSPAAIHDVGSTLLQRKRAKVKISLVGINYAEGDESNWPEGEQVIFDGYIHAVRPSRSTTGAGVIITLYHWISDLNTSHFAYGKYSPSTPWDIFKSKSQINTEGMADWLFDGSEKGIDPGVIYEEDLAKLFIRCLKHSLEDTQLPYFRDGKTDPHHEKAIAALDPQLLESLGCKLKPSVISNGKVFEEQAVIQAMGAIAHNAAGGTTAWTKLLAFCNLFQLIVVCTVDKVYIAPSNPGSTDSGEWIRASELDLGVGSGFEPNLPRGVMMPPSKQKFQTGDKGDEYDGLAVGVMGQFIVDSSAAGAESLAGPIDMIPAPSIFHTDFEVGRAGEEGTADTQIQDDSVEPPDEAGGTGGANSESGPVFPDEWCKHYYWNYVYARRQQLIDSVLRFDITPGAIVLVEIAQASSGDSDIGTMPGFAGDEIVGQVEKVVYSISSERKSVSTTILVKYVKSKAEVELVSSQRVNDNLLFERSYGTDGNCKPLQTPLGGN